MLNLATNLERSAQINPNKVAFIFGDESITYKQFHTQVNQLANSLKARGIVKGDRIALSCPNLPFFPVVYYAVLKLGAVIVPLNILLKAPEIEYHLRDSDAKAYLCFIGSDDLPIGKMGKKAFEACDHCELFVTLAPEGVTVDGHTQNTLMAGQPTEFLSTVTLATDPAVVLYTSGTTGHPKGAELSHSNIFTNAVLSKDLMRMQADSVQAITLPLFHTFGQTVQMSSAIMSGATSILIPRFETIHLVNTMVKHKVTHFCGVPTMYIAMVAAAEHGEVDNIQAGKHLSVAVSGAASLPVEVIERFQKLYDTPIIEGYGLTETSPIACFNHIDRERKPGSIGQAIMGVDVKIANSQHEEVAIGEVGELLVRGHNVMNGYIGRRDATAEAIQDGWFATGDMAKMDDERYVYIVDRIKDMVIRGGFNIYPRELEEIIMTYPGVRQVAVFGVPHETMGEEVMAVIVPDGITEVDTKALFSWCRERMAKFKYPRKIELIDALPVGPSGKVLKRELRDKYSV